MLRRCLTVALASVVLAPMLAPLGARAATNVLTPPAAAEETSLGSLGFLSQVVHGPSPSLDVRFPPPVASLAASGSYLRIFFGHSPLVSAPSNVQVVVNGQRLDDAALTASTAPGAVFVLQVSTMALHPDQPNLVEFDFSLVAAPHAAASELFGRIDADTALHYQLGADAGTMEAYPYSLLGGSLAGSLGPVELGAVIPSAPDDQELSAAFRLVADAGRRLRGATLHITLVSVQQDSWLQTGHSPALLVGRVADLPGSVSLLTAAGFTAAGAGWIAPGATAPISADDGIVAAVISPWDGRSPMLLVTGGSDSAVTRAAAAVLDPRLGARGHAAVVSSVASVGSIEVPDVPFGTLLPRNLAIRGAGDHLIAFAVPEPAIGGGFSATVKLTVSAGHSSAAGASAPELTVEVSGRTVPAPAAAVTGAVVSRAMDIRPELRPGMNAVTVNLHLPEGADEVRLDAELSNSRPLQSQSASSLDQLPDPFLNAPPGTMPTVVLADLQPTTLAGAASAMAALGSRAVVAPAPLGVVILDRDGLLPRNAHSVIVIGGPAGQALRLRSGAFRTEVISPPAGPDSHSGWIAQVALPGGVPALWVGGDPLTLVATGVALADPQLSGHLAVVRLNGQARNVLGSNPGLDVEPFTIALAQLLPVVVGFLLLGVLAVEVGRRWRWAR